MSIQNEINGQERPSARLRQNDWLLGPESLARSTASALVCLTVWAVVAFAVALQGQLFSIVQGQPQGWWSTFGYTAAIFSVWAVMTPLVLKAFSLVAGSKLGRLTRAAVVTLGFPATTALHLTLFVVVFWPLYGSQAPTPLAMAAPVLAANLDNAAFAYAGLLTAAYLRHRTRRNSTDDAQDASEPTAKVPPPPENGLWILVDGARRFVFFGDIDFVSAAGDYVEIHVGGRALLAHRALKTLMEVLPSADFARIHRSTIVRLDRIEEVQALGHGDARLLLRSGDELRLSRRYRSELKARLPV